MGYQSGDIGILRLKVQGKRPAITKDKFIDLLIVKF